MKVLSVGWGGDECVDLVIIDDENRDSWSWKVNVRRWVGWVVNDRYWSLLIVAGRCWS